jgi:FdhE protein
VLQRILDPGQIEAFAQRAVPRIRLPDRSSIFSRRSQRLLQLSASDAAGHAIGDYLRLLAALTDAQHSALPAMDVPGPTAEELARARMHRMPPVHAVGWPRDAKWQHVLSHLCAAIDDMEDVPDSVRSVRDRIRSFRPEQVEAQADALLATRLEEIDLAAAPFIMGALQVYWTNLASRLAALELAELDVQGICPVCGTPPVASIVRADKDAYGYRYLHCSLCATEWHMVRVTCSHCQETKGLTYHSIEGGPQAVRAESCSHCHTYRKILYQEKDMGVEPVADDLASVALDLLLSEEGYHRASGNPLLWIG